MELLTMIQERSAAVDRQLGPVSKVVGLYQMFLRRSLEHFFPDAVLEASGDRSFIEWDGGIFENHHKVTDDPYGLGVLVDWFRTRYTFQPGSPTPFLPSERALIETVVVALDLRFRSLFDTTEAHRVERVHYAMEDMIVTDFLQTEEPFRIPAALEALRVAALSTYENRRVSTGVLLLGTDHDPANPCQGCTDGAPRFNTRLTSIKGFHRLCDGVRTLFVVDRQGELARVADIHTWAETTQGPEPLADPCPRDYVSHAKATRSGGHVCLVLTPSQEIKIFANGRLAFAFSDARWRLLDIPSKFATWRDAVHNGEPGDLARKIFQAALNLSEDRKGALFVVLRDPAESVPNLIAPADRIIDDVLVDDPQDPDNLSPRLAKRALHYAVRSETMETIDPTVLEAIAGLDGAVVTDLEGRILTFGAILRIDAQALNAARAVEGARTLAGLASSFHGPVLKVSEDGFLTMFLGGRRVWEL